MKVGEGPIAGVGGSKGMPNLHLCVEVLKHWLIAKITYNCRKLKKYWKAKRKNLSLTYHSFWHVPCKICFSGWVMYIFIYLSIYLSSAYKHVFSHLIENKKRDHVPNSIFLTYPRSVNLCIAELAQVSSHSILLYGHTPMQYLLFPSFVDTLVVCTFCACIHCLNRYPCISILCSCPNIAWE